MQAEGYRIVREQARREALEEAAVECDKRAKHWKDDPPYDEEHIGVYKEEESELCALAIRALKTPEPV